LELESVVTRCDGTRNKPRGIVMMTMDGFGPRMAANMQIALERACDYLPVGNQKHEARRYVAGRILECAERGNGTVHALTAAGRAAAIELHDARAGIPVPDAPPRRTRFFHFAIR